MAFTQTDIVEIRNKLKQLELADEVQAEVDAVAKMAVAQSWWDALKPFIPTTRAEALVIYQFIEAEKITQRTNASNERNPIQKEIYQFRVKLLAKKLDEANEKYKEIKRSI